MTDSHAFLFADLCGFTEFTRRHGDELGAELAVGFHERVRDLVAGERCEVVKSIGDAVMLRADDLDAALRVGRNLIALGETEGHPRVRAGVDVGPAVWRAGDWYGSTVNTAARVADAAAPGELIVTERARSAVPFGSHVRLLDRGTSELKGLPAMQLHAASAA
jgi:class 3 adenylate cyclase